MKIVAMTGNSQRPSSPVMPTANSSRPDTKNSKKFCEILDVLLQLLDRIEGPFNVESVIDGIDLKISDAIMIFQENGHEISAKVML